MDKVFALERLTPYLLNECCIFSHRTQMNSVCIIILFERPTYTLSYIYILIGFDMETQFGGVSVRFDIKYDP